MIRVQDKSGQWDRPRDTDTGSSGNAIKNNMGRIKPATHDNFY